MSSKRVQKFTSRIQELVETHSEHKMLDRISLIIEEFINGFHFLSEHTTEKGASIFGSARVKPSHRSYKEAKKLASMLSEQGFTIITGGGPGIMEAANKGAFESGGKSLGINIMLNTEQRTNKYVNHSEVFNYFFIRKVMLAFSSEVYVFFPGGFGTLDEFFELTTLIQTKKTHPIPIVLVGKEYWQPLLSWIKNTVFENHSAISKKDMNIYNLVDTADQAFKVITSKVK